MPTPETGRVDVFQQRRARNGAVHWAVTIGRLWVDSLESWVEQGTKPPERIRVALIGRERVAWSPLTILNDVPTVLSHCVALTT